MEYGVWSMAYGVWRMEYGVWSSKKQVIEFLSTGRGNYASG
jgi:hypothetical protein